MIAFKGDRSQSLQTLSAPRCHRLFVPGFDVGCGSVGKDAQCMVYLLKFTPQNCPNVGKYAIHGCHGHGENASQHSTELILADAPPPSNRRLEGKVNG